MLIILFSLITGATFIVNLNLQNKITKTTPLFYEIKEILYQLTKCKQYGSYKVKDSYEYNNVLSIIENYILLKNIVIENNSIVIYSHIYSYKNINYVDKIRFIFKKNYLKKIVYKRIIMKKFFNINNIYLENPTIKNQK